LTDEVLTKFEIRKKNSGVLKKKNQRKNFKKKRLLAEKKNQ